ncbi:bifunctional phosphoribosylaminoimidazolecarboxamide formyltransferase/IMP cyclohydrolase [Alphaproteobacteria bacterium]|nr:bifunctional phosphoribosylaminoimidazolecarboxamide formyltransferase/IMP cyclohydrolase [Alphaproteobacteria bacterium]
MNESPQNKLFTNNIKIKRALISVTEKKGIDILARELINQNIEILSTGGTAKFLEENGILVKDVSKVTGFPEILDGRVKTLHPKIHAGILGKRNNPNHIKKMQEHNIVEIDLVIINLYKFKETIQKTNDDFEIIENIDIGGPAMIRAAAKNHEFICVVTDINDYSKLINQLKDNGSTKYAFRKYLAGKAFKLTNDYDLAISNWFNQDQNENIKLPETISIKLEKYLPMRYGENPHQNAAFYKTTDTIIGVAQSKKLHGKELSYNNINDTDAAFELISEFEYPAVAIIKHANPCGVSENIDINLAWENALQTDPISAFGGIVAINRELSASLANKMKTLFLEVIIAPTVSDEALKVFADKPNVRILISGKIPNPNYDGYSMKSISGGMLVQTRDNRIITKADLKVVTKKLPNEDEINNLIFAWKVAKHTKSNAIIYAKNLQTAGIGAGQMSRIDSTNIANEKAKKSAAIANLNEPLTIGSVVASDAFFPFPDGLIAAADAGVTAVIQPGGSIKDEEVIAAANDRGIVMVFTSIRHFKH